MRSATCGCARTSATPSRTGSGGSSSAPVCSRPGSSGNDDVPFHRYPDTLRMDRTVETVGRPGPSRHARLHRPVRRAADRPVRPELVCRARGERREPARMSTCAGRPPRPGHPPPRPRAEPAHDDGADSPQPGHPPERQGPPLRGHRPGLPQNHRRIRQIAEFTDSSRT